LCGNHGDPIYYPRLIEMIRQFRDRKFSISTNGSYMPEKFWYTLAENLTNNDTIYFSIDGLEHDNHLYRRNANWDSVMTGLDIMVESPARVVWKSIIFSYNQHEIGQMEEMAHDRGAEFIAETTAYFGDDSLKPADQKLIRTDMLYENSKKITEIEPKCSLGYTEFVSADGYYWPCCLISNARVLYKTQLWQEKDKWRIDNQNLDQARQQITVWSNLVKEQGPEAPVSCKMHCQIGQLNYQWSSY
jgi:MoaA/NifB/PqqE/SkfB family radical SAM enzyme